MIHAIRRLVRRMRPMHAALLLVACVACDFPTAPAPPANAVPFDAPSVYRRWWAQTEACSGLAGDLSAVRWYQSPDASIESDGTRYDGVWYPSGNRIALAKDREFDGALVRHEMLHALLQGGGHPRTTFVERCGGVLACIADCLAEESPAPADPSALPVSSSAMQISVALSSATPSSTVDEGNFQLLVTVHNPSSSPVVVDLHQAGGGLYFAAGYVLTSRDGDPLQEGGRNFDRAPEVSRFGPGETRTWIFDFQSVAQRVRTGQLGPGSYTFSGLFGDAEAAGHPVATLAR